MLNSVLVPLSQEQRQAIEQSGTPLPLLDPTSGQPFLLLSVHLSSLPDDSVSATIPGFGLQGEGSEPDEAILALVEAARALGELQ